MFNNHENNWDRHFTEAERAERRAKFIKFAPILYNMLLLEDDFTYLENTINLESDLLPLLGADEASLQWRAVEGATQYAVSVSTNPSTLGQSTNSKIILDTHSA